MIYQITYYRHDTNITEKRQEEDVNMVNLIKRLHKGSGKKGIVSTSMIITIDGTRTHISVCDKCQGIQGVKNYMCKECRK